MRFPPPIRVTAPLLALLFGLVATWLDYRLNLDADVERLIRSMLARAESNGRHLAWMAQGGVGRGRQEVLQDNVQSIADLPLLKSGGIIDANGLVMADITGSLRGQDVNATPLAAAAALIQPGGQPAVRHDREGERILSADPFRIGKKETGWVLLEFDLSAGMDAVQRDAGMQCGVMALAMALLCLLLWIVLHYGFVARLGRLADSVRAFGEGRQERPPLPTGSDEVGQLAGAFAAMEAKLAEREREQTRLEREVLEISESERRRIGHDLHDGLGQRLTAASMSMNALAAALKAHDPALGEQAGDIGRQLRDAIAETRVHSHGLVPVSLVDDGLMSALALLAESTARGGTVRCVFECPDPVRVANAEIAGHLYRIAQEAVNNALKHAEPSEIRIGLERTGTTILLEVDDDGEGFDESAKPAEGIGLRVMRYRSGLIGGTLTFGSAPAGGARISCRVESPV